MAKILIEDLLKPDYALKSASVLGTDITILKPFDAQTLRQCVKDCLSGKSNRLNR